MKITIIIGRLMIQLNHHIYRRTEIRKAKEDATEIHFGMGPQFELEGYSGLGEELYRYNIYRAKYCNSKYWDDESALEPMTIKCRNYVYQFVFEEADDLRIKRFESLNIEWLEFIKENRIKGELQHDYDVVIGPVADDNTMETVQLYISGILKANEAVERLRYSKVNNQISFHTKRALKHLRFVRREKYNGSDLHI